MSETPVPQQQFPIPMLPEEQSRYFNGFALAVGPGDVIMTLTRNGVPTITLNASFSVAKTFAANLTTQIERLEAASKNTIMRVEEITTSMVDYEKSQKP